MIRTVKSRSGYALLVVLLLMVLLVILTASISMSLESGTREARALGAEAQALNAADSGIQYALEAARQGKPIPDRASASWNLLQSGSAVSAWFMVFKDPAKSASCPLNQYCVKSYGEAVRGDRGGADIGLDRILSARALTGVIDHTQSGQEQLINWAEASSP